MIEEKFLEQILLNLGDKAPWLVFAWMVIWRMWPGLQTLLEQYLQARTAAPGSSFVPSTVTIALDDSVREVVNALLTVVMAMNTARQTTADVSPPRAGSSSVASAAGGVAVGMASAGGAARSSDSGTATDSS